MNEIAVKAGQVWMDCDSRRPNRFVTVKSINGDRLKVENVETGQMSSIRTNRMRPAWNGYILVHDPEIAARVQQRLQQRNAGDVVPPRAAIRTGN